MIMATVLRGYKHNLTGHLLMTFGPSSRLTTANPSKYPMEAYL